MGSKYVTFASHNLTFPPPLQWQPRRKRDIPSENSHLGDTELLLSFFLNVFDNLIDHFTVVDLVP